MLTVNDGFLFFSAGLLGLVSSIFGSLFVKFVTDYLDDTKDKSKKNMFIMYMIFFIIILIILLAGIFKFKPV